MTSPPVSAPGSAAPVDPAPRPRARLLDAAARFAAALAVRRELRRLDGTTPEAALDYARGLRWHGGQLRPTQATEEILWLLALLYEERPRTVVEIGTDEGGTLFLWTRVAADDALLVAVDTRPLGRLGRYSPYAIVRRGFARARQRIELMLPRDSHLPATVDELRRRLGGRPVDFLFIDGDHTYDGVRRDFELYAPLVREGGLVAFHDMGQTGPGSSPGVVRFWGELKERYETSELVAAGEPRYGIGVLRMPPRS